jgi:hypothetical protein
MSYAAESYPYIAKQVLTSLTGGAARETHRFLAVLNASGFSTERPADDRVPESLTVAGTSSGAFKVFEEGQDFQVAPDGKIRFFPDVQDALSPAADASWPDEGSEFFISYDHNKTGDALLTDRNPGSLTRTLAESFGRELAVLRKQMENVYRSAYLDTAEGPALERVVALLGIKRKSRGGRTGPGARGGPARHQAQEPRTRRRHGALLPRLGRPRGHLHPRGLARLHRHQSARLVRDHGPPHAAARTAFRGSRRARGGEGTQGRGRRRGRLRDEPDPVGRGRRDQRSAHALRQRWRNGEDDPELRARTRKVLERAGRATPRALHLALAELPGLRENDVKIVEELVDRPGVVQVFVAESDDGKRARQVHEAILNSRPAGVRVEHNFQLNLAATAGAAEGGGAVSTGDVRDEEFEPVGIPGGETFLVPVEVHVLIFPDNPRLSGAEKARMRLDAEQSLMALFDALPLGGAVVYNRLVSALMALGGISDLNLTLHPPEAPAAGLRRNLLPADGQRASLTADKLRIHFAGEVLFDFALKVTLLGTHTLEEAHKEIRGKLSEHFAGAPDHISSADLTALIGTGVNYSLLAADLTWTAEHDAAGLVLVAGGGPSAITPIPEGDRPILRDIVLEPKA